MEICRYRYTVEYTQNYVIMSSVSVWFSFWGQFRWPSSPTLVIIIEPVHANLPNVFFFISSIVYFCFSLFFNHFSLPMRRHLFVRFRCSRALSRARTRVTPKYKYGNTGDGRGGIVVVVRCVRSEKRTAPCPQPPVCLSAQHKQFANGSLLMQQ